MKRVISRSVRTIKKGVKGTLSTTVGSLFGKHSYPLFGIPSGLRRAKSNILVEPHSSPLKSPYTFDTKLHPRFSVEALPLPEFGVIDVPHGIATKMGGTLDHKGRLITTYLVPLDGKKASQHDLFYFSAKRFAPTLCSVDKPVINLTTGWDSAFYHWIYEVLAALYLVRDSNNYLYLNQSTAFQRESLALFGFDPKRIIKVNECDGVRAPVVVIPTTFGAPTPFGSAYLKEVFGKHMKQGKKRRLYISREDAACRRLTNEAELLPLLEKYGFEKCVMRDSSFKEQLQLFHDASHVVGPHGAAFSHLNMCAEKTAVLELFAPRYTHNCYWMLASHNRLNYHYLFGENEGSSEDPDMVIDPEKFERALKHVTAH